ncbi:MAG: hypothetical protein ACREE2_15890 [Stellaceae bacterium]
MPYDCFTVMRRIARRLHHRFPSEPHHGLGQVVHRVRHRLWRRSRLWRRVTSRPPLTLATKVCIATGLAGIGAAGIVAGALAVGPAGSPHSSPVAAALAGAGSAGGAGGVASRAAARAPAIDISVPNPPISFDLDGAHGLIAPVTIADYLVPSAPFGPPDPDDPPDPHAPTLPHDPPTRVPEPSSALILGVALLAGLPWRPRV